MPKEKRKQIDWEAIEKEYRAGQLSIREVARKFNCAESGIRRKAKAENWKRDLSKKINERVRDKIVRTSVRTPNASDEEIIEVNADRGVEVLTLQRKDINNLREIEQKLIKELSGEPTKLYITQYQGKIVEKIVGLTVSEKSIAAANLANVQHKRIALERQAYNLDDSRPPSSDILDEILSEIDGATRGLPSAQQSNQVAQ